jgi:hypothetical protein
VSRITFATNTKPVDLRDLRANDDTQRRLEMDKAQLGYTYRRKRTDTSRNHGNHIGVAAEAILSFWRKKPHQAISLHENISGSCNDEIFSKTHGRTGNSRHLIYASRKTTSAATGRFTLLYPVRFLFYRHADGRLFVARSWL